MAKINLNKCKTGDVLISKHGKTFIYSHKDKKSIYPHQITDPINEKGFCSRTNDGLVFINNRMESDDDIIKIIHINKK